ncbi:hypothetical protein D3C80_545260 [compost metagenome]
MTCSRRNGYDRSGLQTKGLFVEEDVTASGGNMQDLKVSSVPVRLDFPVVLAASGMDRFMMQPEARISGIRFTI